MNILAMCEYDSSDLNDGGCPFASDYGYSKFILALLGFTNNFNNNTISIGMINIEDGSLIDIIYKINDTLFLTYNVVLESQIALSSNNCRFNMIAANIKDFYNKRAMIIVDLANESFKYTIIKDNNDYSGILLFDSRWYSNIDENEMLLALIEDQNSQKLKYIKQVEIIENNTRIELTVICNIKFNNQLYLPAIYGSTTTPYTFWKNYLFILVMMLI